MRKALWEILVPTKISRMDNSEEELWAVTTRYHKVWDAKVREISGGLTVLTPAKGQWISPKNELFIEKMIPVRVYCSKDEMIKISDFTSKYYNQKAIMFYKISDEAHIIHYK